ncbi:hypothetical protein [Tateyamaria sp. SN3-11]|uniref:hypothetical protein n=1 Tax=Tateyamaria sp. SN3-11 TaxID=3092147 RepID=UPI0039E7BBB2
MRTFLSSFGISGRRSVSLTNDYFSRMPPAVFSTKHRDFVPDFSAILLSSELIVDADTLDRLNRTESAQFSRYAAILHDLKQEGIVQAVDYSSIISERADLLEQIMTKDLKRAWEYEDAFSESLTEWIAHLNLFEDEIQQIGVSKLRDDPKNLDEAMMFLSMNMHIVMSDKAFIASTKRLKSAEPGILRFDLVREAADRGALLATLVERIKPYIEYMNTNLLLCEALDAAVFDWSDIVPFYERKVVLSSGEYEGSAHSEGIKRLFKFAFPDVREWPMENILEMARDKRISSLRETINRAIIEEDEIDESFVIRKLGEIIKLQEREARKSKMISFLSSPIGMFPIFGSVLQKPIETAANSVLNRPAKKQASWYFMVSEHAERLNKDQS